MSKAADHATAIITRVADILFVEDYFGTSLAVVVGAVIYGVSRITAALVPSMAAGLGAVGAWFYVLLSVAVFSFRAYRRRKPIPAKVASAMAAIRDARRNHLISEDQAHEMTARLVDNLIDDAVIRGEISRERQRRAAEPDSAQPTG